MSLLPKTDWKAGDVPGASDFNRIEVNSYGKQIRQVVINSIVDGNGQAAFLTPVSNQLAVTLLATTTPFRASIAQGSDDYGNLDTVVSITSDRVKFWNNLPANKTAIFLYINVDGTAGYSLLQRVEALVAPSAPAIDQHWFDINTKKMFVWDGAAWVDTGGRLFVGECATNNTAVTTVISYALNGYYESTLFSVSTNGAYTKTHNFGYPKYSVEVHIADNANGTNERPEIMLNSVCYPGTTARNAIDIKTGDNAGITTGGVSTASGYLRVIIRRTWQ